MHHATRPPRLLSILTALALLAPPSVQAAPADDSKALAAFESGFNEGQAKFDRGENLEAARTWIAAAANLKETTAHRDNRVAVYEYVVDAFTRGLANEKRADALREAAEALDAYCDGFTRAYGTETPLSAKVTGARDDFKKRVAAAEAAPPPVDDPPDLPPGDTGGGDDDPPPVVDTPEGGKPWKGLVIGGGVAIGLGIAGAVLSGVGGIRGKKLEQEFDDPAKMCTLEMPSGPCQDLLDDGKSANTLTVAGAVIAPLFIGAGVALLAIGLKRKSSNKTAFAPNLSPTFLGLTVRGSF